MTPKGSILPLLPWAIGLAVLFLSWSWPRVLEQASLPLALALIACIGIPHGATDQLLFLQMSRLTGKVWGLPLFYLAYLGLILVYALLWFVFPWLGFVLFIALSVYHFGQADWNAALPRSTVSGLYFVCWGSFVLLTPVMWHYDSSKPIIEAIVRAELPAWEPSTYTRAAVAPAVLNLCLLLWGAAVRRLSPGSFRLGLAQLFFLFVLFISTPLLLGFALYFAGWHALRSMQDQILFLKTGRKEYSWKHYVRDAAAFSLLALAGIGAAIWFFRSGGLIEALGLLFMGIAAITLPHMILMDQLYKRFSENIHAGNNFFKP